jgi:hypothetical protein
MSKKNSTQRTATTLLAAALAVALVNTPAWAGKATPKLEPASEKRVVVPAKQDPKPAKRISATKGVKQGTVERAPKGFAIPDKYKDRYKLPATDEYKDRYKRPISGLQALPGPGGYKKPASQDGFGQSVNALWSQRRSPAGTGANGNGQTAGSPSALPPQKAPGIFGSRRTPVRGAVSNPKPNRLPADIRPLEGRDYGVFGSAIERIAGERPLSPAEQIGSDGALPADTVAEVTRAPVIELFEVENAVDCSDPNAGRTIRHRVRARRGGPMIARIELSAVHSDGSTRLVERWGDGRSWGRYAGFSESSTSDDSTLGAGPDTIAYTLVVTPTEGHQSPNRRVEVRCKDPFGSEFLRRWPIWVYPVSADR